jgi:uncharacterized membrane protein SpoIIM required for sporulation
LKPRLNQITIKETARIISGIKNGNKTAPYDTLEPINLYFVNALAAISAIIVLTTLAITPTLMLTHNALKTGAFDHISS